MLFAVLCVGLLIFYIARIIKEENSIGSNKKNYDARSCRSLEEKREKIVSHNFQNTSFPSQENAINNQYKEKQPSLCELDYKERQKRKLEAERQGRREKEREEELRRKREEEINNIKYGTMIFSICEKLEGMNLYDRLYEEELEKLYPMIKHRFAKVNDINKILHKCGKEVTYLNGYYILVEPGTHEERVKSIEKMNINKEKLYEPERYRDDISNIKGTFHLPRESNGRIASGFDEDSYGDDDIPPF